MCCTANAVPEATCCLWRSGLCSLSYDPTLSSGRYPFREALRAQCAARPAQCRYMERVTEERGVLGSAAGAFVKGLAVYDRAWFCLQPHGDTPTRQAWCGCPPPLQFPMHSRVLSAAAQWHDPAAGLIWLSC